MDCRGTHLIADLWGCEGLDDAGLVERALREAAAAAGAVLLRVDVHGFGPGQGVTGVAMLAESHVSVHTWPEHGYAACDVFLCGRTQAADAALESLVESFHASRRMVQHVARGSKTPPT